MEIIIALAIFGVLAYAWYVNANRKPSKPVDLVQPNPVADVAEKNIKETTEAVIAKVEATPVAESKPEVKETPWIEKQPTPIAKTNKPRQQSVKAVPAPKKKKPATKS